MNKIITICSIMGLLLGIAQVADALPTKTWEYSLTGVDMGTGGKVFAWNLDGFSIPAGQQITGAVLTYVGLQDGMDSYATDHLYTHLLDNFAGGSTNGWKTVVSSGDSEVQITTTQPVRRTNWSVLMCRRTKTHMTYLTTSSLWA